MRLRWDKKKGKRGEEARRRTGRKRERERGRKIRQRIRRKCRKREEASKKPETQEMTQPLA